LYHRLKTPIALKEGRKKEWEKEEEGVTRKVKRKDQVHRVLTHETPKSDNNNDDDNRQFKWSSSVQVNVSFSFFRYSRLT